MKPAISIIIPAYNAEKSFIRCLDSISGQTFHNFEVLIIDDGSQDATGRIADDYASRDSRFSVLHKKNGGVAAARQDGIERVRGEFTLFVDSDDYILPDMLQRMYQSAIQKGADLVICDFNLIRNEKVEYWNQQPPSMTWEHLLGAMFYLCPLWNKLIRTSCFREPGIRFVEGINAGEDHLFILKVLACNQQIKAAYVGEAFYQYDLTQNNTSITNIGINAEQRMLPLVLFQKEYDTTPAQAAFDNAILHIAYDYLKRPDLSPDFKRVFYPFRKNIQAAKGLPLHVKVLVMLKLHGI